MGQVGHDAVMPAPELIGRYRLGPRLGSGGFSVVWLAHDESLDTQIAIKIMAENWADRMDLRDRFLTEARMLRRAASGRLVQVFDIGELPDGRPYFVMEYADRGTLADRAAAGGVTLVQALRLTAEVARGVAELHRAGIVHRDIKPSNVLITSTPDGGERLLVADLGVAKSLAQASGLTMSVGSAGYMAPEQAEPSTGVDIRADVYSLGALGYHLITGDEPGPPGRVISPDRSPPDLPPDVRRVLVRALEPERDRRWPDAPSLAVELDRLADRLEPARAPSKQPSNRGRRPRRRSVVAAIITVIALVGAGLGLAEWRRVASEPVTVRDGSGQISIDVPPAWSRQRVPGGWNPQVLKLSGDHAPGLLVADDVGDWGRLEANVDGVFVGLSTDPGLPAAVAAISHPNCRFAGARPWANGNWRGQVRRWSGCRGGSRSLTEISLTATGGKPELAYLQVRQDGGADAVPKLLDGLRVRH
jgi:eukaryotic-like serine/threonine-protein kinase